MHQSRFVVLLFLMGWIQVPDNEIQMKVIHNKFSIDTMLLQLSGVSNGISLCQSGRYTLEGSHVPSLIRS